ncbi:MAG: M15 family metallopeptidase [Gammaproteobacteria bacterium]|nr:M15 family metallopeptidase [Gammaproteobacteria bacterium]
MNNNDETQTRLKQLHQALGIPSDYVASCALPLCLEPALLVDTELDFYKRQQRLTPAAFTAWSEMREAATNQGISLFLISAFRGYQYQHDLIAGKLEKGQVIDAILRVNAAPGYSEHHSGRAVDLGTMGCDALSENFAKTKAYQWLTEHSSSYGFFLSYPLANPFGIDFEPWHWCYKEE